MPMFLRFVKIEGQSKESQESRQTRLGLEKTPKVEKESLHGSIATSQYQTKARLPQRGGKGRDLNEKKLRIRNTLKAQALGPSSQGLLDC